MLFIFFKPADLSVNNGEVCDQDKKYGQNDSNHHVYLSICPQAGGFFSYNFCAVLGQAKGTVNKGG